MTQLVQLAQQYCARYHDGQFRKGSNLPFASHPEAVVHILRSYGYRDEVTQCIGYLHDIIEDTPLDIHAIKECFGYEIANGVYILSKNTLAEPSNELYKQRLSFARKKIQRVKIADMIHNTQDLTQLNEKGRERKLEDAREFYIPLGQSICPIMVSELERNIENYFRKEGKQ